MFGPFGNKSAIFIDILDVKPADCIDRSEQFSRVAPLNVCSLILGSHFWLLLGVNIRDI